jgi:integrase
LLDEWILPAMGKLWVKEIKLTDCGALHHCLGTSINPRTGKPRHRTANQCLAIVSKMLSLAEAWGLRDPLTNPCGAIERYAEEKRERYLTLEELRSLGRRMKGDDREAEEHPFDPDKESPYALASVRLILLTGMRRGEVHGLRRDQVDMEGGKITFQALDHKTGAKMGRKVIHLSEAALDVLRDLPMDRLSAYVFPGETGGQCGSTRACWDRIRAGQSYSDVRAHDLRHTFASYGIAEGLSLEDVGHLLGHKAPATTKRYAHLIDARAKETAAKTGGSIASKLG